MRDLHISQIPSSCSVGSPIISVHFKSILQEVSLTVSLGPLDFKSETENRSVAVVTPNVDATNKNTRNRMTLDHYNYNQPRAAVTSDQKRQASRGSE